MELINKKLSKSIYDSLAYSDGLSVDSIISEMFNTIMKFERDQFLEISRSLGLDNKGNGYYERFARAVEKYFTLHVPRDRDGVFKPFMLEVVKKQDQQLLDLASILYRKGLTCHEIQEVLHDIFGKKLSESRISQLSTELNDMRDAWLNRQLSEYYHCILIDATYIPVRRDSVSKEAYYVVLGVNEHMKREVIGIYNIPSESSNGWKEVFTHLKGRGFRKSGLFICDELTGIQDAILEEFRNTRIQFCTVHKKRNVLLKVRAKDKKIIAEELKDIFPTMYNDLSKEAAKQNLNEFVDKWSKIYPSIKSSLINDNTENYFTYLDYPLAVRGCIYTTNWLERLNRDIKRTTKVRNSFPNPESALYLVTDVCMHVTENTYRYAVPQFLRVRSELDEIKNKILGVSDTI